ncbi:ABC transporter permease [Chitinibacteraceae bacterium HSL-7]
MVETCLSIFGNRGLIFKLARRDVLLRYKGSVFGLFWSFFHPVFMLVVYTLFFGLVFKAKWAGVEGTKEFALILFAGLLVYNLFSECVGRSPGLILSNANYVKKVIFPIEVLPIVAMLSAFFHFVVSLGVWFFFAVLIVGHVEWTALLSLVVILPFLLVLLGVMWFLAAIGVYLRDVSQVTSLIVMAASFASPIFYPVSILPEWVQSILYVNPLVFIIEQMRVVLFYGKMPDWTGLALYCVFSVVVAFIGLHFFQKLRRGFSDVL